MSYSAPTSKSTGDTVSAAEWNVIVDDILETPAALVTTKGDVILATGANAVARLGVPVVSTTPQTGYTLISDDSATNDVAWQMPQYVGASFTGTQSLTSGSEAAVSFTGTDDFDSNSLHSTSSNPTRLTASVKGIYHVGGYIVFANVSAAANRRLRIRKNGSTTVATIRDLQPSGSSDVSELALSALVALDNTQYVELMATQNSGSSLNVTSGAFWMYMVAKTA